MAALMRMSRLVNSSVIQRIFNSGVQVAPMLTPVNSFWVKSFPSQRQIPLFLARHQSSLREEFASKDKPLARGPRSAGNSSIFEDKLERFAFSLSRFNRVHVQQLNNCLKRAEALGKITQLQGSIILRGCGDALVYHNVEQRQEIFKDVSERLQKLVENPDISYENCILKVRLENKDYFDPVQALADIESRPNLPANRVTYQLLIKAYCLQGDLDGATKILEHMKELNISISHEVFHSLIIGYMKTGNGEAARDVFNMMRDAGILPDYYTYGTLMCGFAEKGNLVEIQKVRSEAEQDEVSLDHKQFFKVLVVLAENGHDAAFEELLRDMAERYSMMQRYNIEGVMAANKLIALGMTDEALKIYKTMKVLVDDDYNSRLSSNMLGALITQNQPYEKLKHVCKELVQLNILPNADLNALVGLALDFDKKELVAEIMDDLVQKGPFIRQDNVQKIIDMKQRAKDVDGIIDFIKARFDLSNFESCDIFQYSWKALRDMGMSAEDIYLRLKECNASDVLINKYRFMVNIETAELDEAQNYLKEQNLVESVAMSPRLMKASWSRPNCDHEKILEVLFLLGPHLSSGRLFKDLCTFVLIGLLKSRHIDTSDSAEKLVRDFLAKDVFLEEAKMHLVSTSLTEIGVNSETHKELMDGLYTKCSNDEKVPRYRKQRMKLILDQYKKNPDSISALARSTANLYQLREYLREQDVEKADKLKEQMDMIGFHFRGFDNFLLSMYYAESKHDLKKALQYRDTAVEEMGHEPGFLSVVLAGEYIRNNDIEIARQILTGTTKTLKGEQLLRTRIRPFIELVYSTHPQFIDEFIDKLVEGGYAKRNDNCIVFPLMEQALKSDDPDRLLEICERIHIDKGQIPLFHEVLVFFVKTEDASRLQKVVDMLSMWRGEPDVLHHLAIAFIECGKLRQAQKIVENPEFKSNRLTLQKVFSYRDYSFSKDKVPVMEKFVSMMRHAPYCDRDEALFSLIQIYARVSEFQKCLDVLTIYEEEGQIPRARTLRYLAKALQSNNIAVPFTVPEPMADIPVPAPTVATLKPAGKSFALNEQEQNIYAKVKQRGLEYSPLDVLQDLKDDEGKLNMKSVKNLIIAMMTDGSVFSRRFSDTLLVEVGNTNKIDDLRFLKDVCHSNRLKILYYEMLAKTLIQSGNADELLDGLKNDYEEWKMIVPTTAMTLLQESRPDIYEQVFSLVDTKFHENPENMNSVYNLFLLKAKRDDYSGAQALAEKYPAVKKQITASHFLPVISEKIYPKDELVEFVLNLLETKPPSYRIYSRWLLYKVNQEDIPGLTHVIEHVQKNNLNFKSIFNNRLLEGTEKLLEQNGIPVPWTTETDDEVMKAGEQA